MDERASKIGFILPKKLIKKGVYRNKIKRWLRKIVKDSGFIIDIVLLVNVPLNLKTKNNKKVLYFELLELFRSI